MCHAKLYEENFHFITRIVYFDEKRKKTFLNEIY